MKRSFNAKNVTDSELVVQVLKQYAGDTNPRYVTRDVAKEIGVSYGTLLKWRNGEASLSSEHRSNFIKFLNKEQTSLSVVGSRRGKSIKGEPAAIRKVKNSLLAVDERMLKMVGEGRASAYRAALSKLNAQRSKQVRSVQDVQLNYSELVARCRLFGVHPKAYGDVHKLTAKQFNMAVANYHRISFTSPSTFDIPSPSLSIKPSMAKNEVGRCAEWIVAESISQIQTLGLGLSAFTTVRQYPQGPISLVRDVDVAVTLRGGHKDLRYIKNAAGDREFHAMVTVRVGDYNPRDFVYEQFFRAVHSAGVASALAFSTKNIDNLDDVAAYAGKLNLPLITIEEAKDNPQAMYDVIFNAILFSNFFAEISEIADKNYIGCNGDFDVFWAGINSALSGTKFKTVSDNVAELDWKNFYFKKRLAFEA